MASVAAGILSGLEGLATNYEAVMLDSGGGTGLAGYIHFPAAARSVLFGDYDLLHLHVAMKGSTVRKAIFATLGRLSGRPYVIHLHGSSYDSYVQGLAPGFGAVVSFFFRHASAVIVLGERWRDLVIHDLGVEENRVHIIHNGVGDVGAWESPGPGDSRMVLFLGVVSRRKGLDVLIEAFDCVSRAGGLEDWRLVVAGPVQEDELLELAQERGIECPDRVQFVGPVFGDDKVRLWREAAIFVLPSRAEAMPMAILEAMSAGLPCVASAVGSVGEVIRGEGDGGLTVSAGSAEELAGALTRLMIDSGLRAELGRRARARWEEGFTLGMMAAAVAKVWDGIISPDANPKAPGRRRM